MSKERFEVLYDVEYRDYEVSIYDNEKYEDLDDLHMIARKLNQQDQEIQELKKQLENAIVPKFKIGQTVWYIYGKKIKSFTISKIEIEIEIRFALIVAYSNHYVYQFEENCFATKEEAQAKLKELQGE